MKRFFLVMGIAVLLLCVVGVGAQDGCGMGLSNEDCALLTEAMDELGDSGELNFDYSLSVQVFYGASARRQLFISGAGTLDRGNNGVIESFEIATFVTARNYNNYDFLNREEYFTQYFFHFEENEFSFAEEGNRGELIEFDIETLELGTLFPFLIEAMPGNISAETIELQREEYRHYLGEVIPVEGGIFAPFYTLVFGQEIAGLDGEGFYDASLLVNLDDEEVAGTSYSAYEFLDGEQFGLEQELRRQTNWLLRILPENVSSYEDFRVGNEQDDDDGIYAAAAEYGPLGLIAAALTEPLSDIYPPMFENQGLGGINLDEVMGGELEPDATATASRTPSPANTAAPRPTSTAFPTMTPVPLLEGYPCQATIAGEEGSIQSVVHREPTEEAVVVVAARAGQEVRVTFYIETDEGRWYHVEINRAVGYVHEDNIVLGEDCGE